MSDHIVDRHDQSCVETSPYQAVARLDRSKLNLSLLYWTKVGLLYFVYLQNLIGECSVQCSLMLVVDDCYWRNWHWSSSQQNHLHGAYLRTYIA